MTGLLQSRDSQKHVVGEFGDAVRPGQPRLAPDLRCVTTIAVLLQAFGKPSVLGRECLDLEGGRLGDERDRSLAEIPNTSLDVYIGTAHQQACPPPGYAPDQSAILRVEVLDALVGFDDLWATDADTRMRGYDNAIAAGGDDAAPTE